MSDLRGRLDAAKEAVTAAGRRHVRTPEGAKRFGQGIGEVIVPDIYVPRGSKLFSKFKKGDVIRRGKVSFELLEDPKKADDGSMVHRP